MIGLDTNVLLRMILQDEPQQSARAEHIIRHVCTTEEPGFISLLTVAEIVWVLSSVYRFSPPQIAMAIDSFLRTDALTVQNQDEVFFALAAFRSGKSSFADALIGALAEGAGCTTTLTFDVKASRLPGFTLIQGT